MAAADIQFAEGFGWLTSETQLSRRAWTNQNTTIQSGNGPYGENTVKCSGAFKYISRETITSDPQKAAFSFHLYYNALPPSLADGIIANVPTVQNNPSYNWGLAINYQGKLILYGPGGAIETSTLTIVAGRWYHIEGICNTDNAGQYDVWVDGTSYLSGTGDQEGGHLNDYWQIGIWGNSTGNFEITNIILQEGAGSSQLTEQRVQTVLPDGNGNSSGLTGSDADSTDNYLHVDEVPSDDDTSYVEATSGKDLYTFANVDSNATILAAQATFTAKKTDAATRNIRAVARSGGTDYNGSNQVLSGSYNVYSERWVNDPDTAAAWTPSGLNAAEFGPEVS